MSSSSISENPPEGEGGEAVPGGENQFRDFVLLHEVQDGKHLVDSLVLKALLDSLGVVDGVYHGPESGHGGLLHGDLLGFLVISPGDKEHLLEYLTGQAQDQPVSLHLAFLVNFFNLEGDIGGKLRGCLDGLSHAKRPVDSL